MAAPALGPWEPLDVPVVLETFASAPFRWWISGGHALDLHVRRRWRAHEDIDVGVVREELPALRELLQRWDLHIAAAGRLTPWRGEALDAARHENNLWGRLHPNGPWNLDITIGDGTPDEWVYRRVPSIRVPWEQAVLRTAADVPYLAPELQLLYKSAGRRPKDDVDAAEVIPSLEPDRRVRLANLLDPDHPWQQLLDRLPS